LRQCDDAANGDDRAIAQGIAAKTGTSVRIFPTHAWASATLACIGVVFGDIGTPR